MLLKKSYCYGIYYRFYLVIKTNKKLFNNQICTFSKLKIGYNFINAFSQLDTGPVHVICIDNLLPRRNLFAIRLNSSPFETTLIFHYKYFDMTSNSNNIYI